MWLRSASASLAISLILLSPAGMARSLPPAPVGVSVSADESVVEAERRNLAVEIEMLQRKTESLTHALDEQRLQTRHHLRLLYKLSAGGYLRLLAGADSPAEFYQRRDGVGRILERDLAELHSLREALRELDQERARLHSQEQRAAELRALAATQAAQGFAPPAGFPGPPGALTRPVAGATVATFGSLGDAVGRFDHVCDGMELRTAPGDVVRAAAAGMVRWAGEVAGLGLSVIIEHGGGWMSLTGGLASPLVIAGSHVAAGDPLGHAGGAAVEFQLMRNGNWIDPAPWIAPAP